MFLRASWEGLPRARTGGKGGREGGGEGRMWVRGRE